MTQPVQEAREAFAEADQPIVHDLQEVVANAGHTFLHILLFNSLASTGDATAALDNIGTLHNQLVGYHAFLSGFSFLGLCQWTDIDEFDNVVQAYTGALVCSFFFSAMGSMISFVALEYSNGMRGESTEAIVLGILRYWRFFYLSDILAFMATFSFITSVQIMIYKTLPKGACLAINIATGCFAAVGLVAFYMIVPAKQNYSRQGVKATRKIYQKKASMKPEISKPAQIAGG